MKKSMSIVLVLILTTILVVASNDFKIWTAPVLMGAGKKALVSGVTGKKIVLRNMMLSIKNACYLYFYSDGTTKTRKSIDYYMAANSNILTLDKIQTIDIETVSGEGLGVWSSADPAAYIQLTYETKD